MPPPDGGLPGESDEFFAEAAARAEKLHFEWWRIKLGTEWRGGLDPEHQKKMDTLAQILKTLGRPVFGEENGR